MLEVEKERKRTIRAVLPLVEICILAPMVSCSIESISFFESPDFLPLDNWMVEVQHCLCNLDTRSVLNQSQPPEGLTLTL